MSALSECRSAILHDHLSYGIDCVKSLLDVKEIHVTYDSDSARLKRDALGAAKCESADSACTDNADVLVIRNATLLMMDVGILDQDLLPRGTIVVKGGVIRQVGRDVDIDAPQGATVIDARGGNLLGSSTIHLTSMLPRVCCSWIYRRSRPLVRI